MTKRVVAVIDIESFPPLILPTLQDYVGLTATARLVRPHKHKAEPSPVAVLEAQRFLLEQDFAALERRVIASLKEQPMRHTEPMRSSAGQNRSHMDSIKQDRRAAQRERQLERRNERGNKRSQAY